MTAGIRVSVTQPSAPASMEHTQHRVAIWSFFDFFNMESPVIFAGALTIFAGSCPNGHHPGDGVVGSRVAVGEIGCYTKSITCLRHV